MHRAEVERLDQRGKVVHLRHHRMIGPGRRIVLGKLWRRL
jgi:hypothetical protein